MINQTNLPLITAVMITGKEPSRKRLAYKSLESFWLQDYPEKKIVIINTSPEDWFSSCTKAFPGQCVEIHPQEDLSLGELRNLGEFYSESELIIQWDDDDYCLPTRMMVQYEILRAQKASACLLNSQVRSNLMNPLESFYHYAHEQVNRWGGIEGTVLYDRTKAIKYPDLSKGEDTAFLKQLSTNSVAVAKTCPLVYIRWYHGKNTWDKEHMFRHCRKNEVSKEDFSTICQIAEGY